MFLSFLLLLLVVYLKQKLFFISIINLRVWFSYHGNYKYDHDDDDDDHDDVLVHASVNQFTYSINWCT